MTKDGLLPDETHPSFFATETVSGSITPACRCHIFPEPSQPIHLQVLLQTKFAEFEKICKLCKRASFSRLKHEKPLKNITTK
jgi:hypothetical protein